MRLTFSLCVVDFRWLAGVAFTHGINGNDPETVGHVGLQREDNTLLVSGYFHQFFQTPFLGTLVLKLNHILCRDKKECQGVMDRDGRT